jgi:hypothetical protein
VEEENQIIHDEGNVHGNQAPTPADIEQKNMPDDDHDDQTTQDTSILLEIAGVEASPFICCSSWVIRKAERLIETYMLNAKGFHRVQY